MPPTRCLVLQIQSKGKNSLGLLSYRSVKNDLICFWYSYMWAHYDWENMGNQKCLVPRLAPGFSCDFKPPKCSETRCTKEQFQTEEKWHQSHFTAHQRILLNQQMLTANLLLQRNSQGIDTWTIYVGILLQPKIQGFLCIFMWFYGNFFMVLSATVPQCLPEHSFKYSHWIHVHVHCFISSLLVLFCILLSGYF